MRELFPIVPGSSGPLVLVAVMAVFFGVLLAMFGWFAWSARSASLEVTGEGVCVLGAMYGRSIPLSHIRAGDAVATQVRTGDLRLVARTNGAGLPGYLAGWFRAANGEKILAFVTDKEHVVYLPTTEGYSLVFSVADPGSVVAAVRRAAAH